MDYEAAVMPPGNPQGQGVQRNAEAKTSIHTSGKKEPSIVDVVLVGTSHIFQFGIQPACCPEQRLAFAEYLGNVCRRYGAVALAEEMSQDALNEVGAATSVVRSVALAANIAHIYCDPSRNKQVALGIRDEGTIKLHGSGFPLIKQWSPQQIANAIQDARSRREAFWLDRLFELDRWPVVFVLGSLHLESFKSRVKSRGKSCVVDQHNWGGEPILDE